MQLNDYIVGSDPNAILSSLFWFSSLINVEYLSSVFPFHRKNSIIRDPLSHLTYLCPYEPTAFSYNFFFYYEYKYTTTSEWCMLIVLQKI